MKISQCCHLFTHPELLTSLSHPVPALKCTNNKSLFSSQIKAIILFDVCLLHINLVGAFLPALTQCHLPFLTLSVECKYGRKICVCQLSTAVCWIELKVNSIKAGLRHTLTTGYKNKPKRKRKFGDR